MSKEQDDICLGTWWGGIFKHVFTHQANDHLWVNLVSNANTTFTLAERLERTFNFDWVLHPIDSEHSYIALIKHEREFLFSIISLNGQLNGG